MTENTQIVKAVDEIKGTLMQMGASLPLPKHINPDRFVAVAQMAIASNASLVSCDRNSLYNAFTLSAQDGLFPDGREAAIVPFKGKAKYMPMVAGICKKARNSGEISAIDAVVVYEGDEYDSWVDEKGPHFRFKRVTKERGNPVLTFAYAVGKDGGCFFEEIDEAQMKAIESKSNASDSPWKGPFRDEMRRKSALRRLGKYRLPSSSDLTAVFGQDNEFYEDPEDSEAKEEKTSPSRLGAIIEAQANEAPQAPPPPAAPKPQPLKSADPAKTKPAPAPRMASLQTRGKIEDIKVKDGQFQGGTRRYACKIDGKFYGTYEKSISEDMQKAVDGGNEVVIGFTERKENNTVFRDIVSFLIESEQAESFSEEEVPI